MKRLLEIAKGLSDHNLMIILRFIGSWFIVFGVIAMVSDASRATTDNEWINSTSILDYWQRFHVGSLTATQEAFEKNGIDFIWDPIMVLFLGLPAWFMLLGFGLLFFLLGRRRKRVEIFLN